MDMEQVIQFINENGGRRGTLPAGYPYLNYVDTMGNRWTWVQADQDINQGQAVENVTHEPGLVRPVEIMTPVSGPYVQQGNLFVPFPPSTLATDAETEASQGAVDTQRYYAYVADCLADSELYPYDPGEIVGVDSADDNPSSTNTDGMPQPPTPTLSQLSEITEQWFIRRTEREVAPPTTQKEQQIAQCLAQAKDEELEKVSDSDLDELFAEIDALTEETDNARSQ